MKIESGVWVVKNPFKDLGAAIIVYESPQYLQRYIQKKQIECVNGTIEY